jgi:hypothetical protein
MDSNTELLTVVGQKAIPDDDVILDIDYVSTCRIGEETSNYYLILGDRKHSLLEVVVAQYGHYVSGLVLVIFNEFKPWVTPQISMTVDKIPVLKSDIDDYKVLGIGVPFGVSTHERDILLSWGPLDNCTAYRAGPVDFLVHDEQLVGAWFKDLDESCIELFKTQIAVPSEPIFTDI